MNVLSLAERVDNAVAIAPAGGESICATPYKWRDPATIPTRRWLYGRTLLRGSLSMLVAPGASGKTALIAGMALSLVSGRDLVGQRVWEGPCRTWIWNLEDSREEMERLIQAGAKHWGLTQDDLNDRLFLDCAMSGKGLILADEATGVRVPTNEALRDELIARRVDVLMLDPLVSAHRAPENDNGRMDELAKALSQTAEAAQCAILVAHHTAKLKGTEASAESARGASALINAARSVPTINKMTSEEANRFGIVGDLRRRYFRVYDDKGNRAPPADASSWYHLHSVPLCNGIAGDGGDSLPVVVPWFPPDAFDGLSMDHLRRVQAAVADGEWRESSQSADWVGNAIADVVGLDLNQPTDKARTKLLLKEWLRSGVLKIQSGKDGKSNPRKFVVVGRDADDVSPPSQGEDS